MKRVLVPLAPGFEEIEAVTIIDILRRADVHVTVAGTLAGPITGSHGVIITPDTTLDTVTDATFDMVVLPGGGPGTEALRRDVRVASLLKRHADRGEWVAAICAAPTVLADAGLLAGRRVTSFPSVQSQLSATDYRTFRVVVDGRIITSRSPGTALEFALTLVEHLVGRTVSRRIAGDVLAMGAVGVGVND
jgi:4-methyl-5(b-hydroxyethyl)-thiazole monophosphate biosynthesis